MNKNNNKKKIIIISIVILVLVGVIVSLLLLSNNNVDYEPYDEVKLRLAEKSKSVFDEYLDVNHITEKHDYIINVTEDKYDFMYIVFDNQFDDEPASINNYYDKENDDLYFISRINKEPDYSKDGVEIYQAERELYEYDTQKLSVFYARIDYLDTLNLRTLFSNNLNLTYIEFGDNNHQYWSQAEVNLDLNSDGVIKTYLNDNKCYILSEYNMFFTEDMSGLFKDLVNLEEVVFNNINTQFITDMSYMFYNCKKLKTITGLEFNGTNVKLTNLSNMFYNCEELETIDLTTYKTSRVTSFENMFYNCTKLNNLDLSSFRTVDCINFNQMFYNTTSLDNLTYRENKFIIKNNPIDMFTNNSKYDYDVDSNKIIIK